jgi:hypothetical protein
MKSKITLTNGRQLFGTMSESTVAGRQFICITCHPDNHRVLITPASIAQIEELTDETWHLTISTARSRSTAAIRRIFHTVADANGITVGQLCARDRHEPLVTWRHTAIYLARAAGFTARAISTAIPSSMDHATILHAQKRISDLMDVEPETREMVLNLATVLKINLPDRIQKNAINQTHPDRAPARLVLA